MYLVLSGCVNFKLYRRCFDVFTVNFFAPYSSFSSQILPRAHARAFSLVTRHGTRARIPCCDPAVSSSRISFYPANSFYRVESRSVESPATAATVTAAIPRRHARTAMVFGRDGTRKRYPASSSSSGSRCSLRGSESVLGENPLMPNSTCRHDPTKLRSGPSASSGDPSRRSQMEISRERGKQIFSARPSACTRGFGGKAGGTSRTRRVFVRDFLWHATATTGNRRHPIRLNVDRKTTQYSLF